MSSIADGFFNCRETPVNFPTGLKLTNVPGSSTALLRIISRIPGPGNYTGPTDFYFDINENPTTSIHFNGFMYNLSHSYLCFPGVHRVSGESKPCDAEMVLFFKPSQTTTNPQPPIILCVPVDSGIKFTKNSEKYFNSITSSPTANRPTFASILPPKPTFIQYLGFNFMLRIGQGNTIKKCSDIPQASQNNVRYLVCQQPIGIGASDYNRFVALLPKKPRKPNTNDYEPLEQLIKPPRCDSDVSSARFTDLVTHITKVTLIADDMLVSSSLTAKDSKGVPISSMKCKRITKNNNGGLRMDMTDGGGKTLANELSATQDDLKTMDLGKLDPGMPTPDPIVKPGDIEKGIGITLGIVFAVILGAFVSYWTLRFVYINYTTGLKLYGNAPPTKTPPFNLPKIPAMPKLCP